MSINLGINFLVVVTIIDKFFGFFFFIWRENKKEGKILLNFNK